MPRGIPKSGVRRPYGSVTGAKRGRPKGSVNKGKGAARGSAGVVLAIVATIVKLLMKLSPEIRDLVLSLVDERMRAEAPPVRRGRKPGPKPKPAEAEDTPTPVTSAPRGGRSKGVSTITDPKKRSHKKKKSSGKKSVRKAPEVEGESNTEDYETSGLGQPI